MMNIESIELSGFKGGNERLSLSELNLIIGNNGSGKTRIIQAIQWACEGKSALGEKPDSIRPLASPSGCSVAVCLSDGFRWRRSFEIDHQEGKTKQRLDIAGQEDLSIKDSQAVLNAHIGGFAPMFDLSRFTALSADRKRDFILSLCGQGGGLVNVSQLTGRAVVEHCRVSLGTVVDHMVDGGSTVTEIMAKLSEPERRELEQLRDNLPAQSDDAAAWIADALQYAKDEANQSKRLRDDAHASSRAISERRAAIQVAAESADSIKSRMEELRRQYSDICGQIERQRGRETAVESLKRSIEDNKQARAHIDAEADRLSETFINPSGADWSDDKAQELKAGVAELERKFEDDNTPALQRAAREAREALQKAESEHQKTIRTLERYENDRTVAKQRFEECRSNVWTKLLDKLCAVVPPVDTQTETDAAHWSGIFDLVNEQAEHHDPAPWSERIGELDAAIEALRHAVQDLESTVAKQREACDAAMKASEDALLARQSAGNEILALKDQYRELTDTAARIRRECEEVEKARQANVERWAENEKQRLELTGRLDQLMAEGGHVDVDELTAQRDRLSEAIAQDEAKLESKTRYASLDAEYHLAIQVAERQELRHNVAKQFANAIRTIRDDMMTKLAAPLVDRINRFLSAHVQDTQAYCRLVDSRGKPTFELGWIMDDMRLPYEALSGGEQAMFGAALAYALVDLKAPPLRLLLLEVGEVDRPHLRWLCDALETVKDQLSNVLVCTHAWEHAALDGWNVIERSAMEMVS